MQQMKLGFVKVKGKSFNVKNVKMKVLYICSNLLNTFTVLIDPTILRFVNVIPPKPQHPSTFFSAKEIL